MIRNDPFLKLGALYALVRIRMNNLALGKPAFIAGIVANLGEWKLGRSGEEMKKVVEDQNQINQSVYK